MGCLSCIFSILKILVIVERMEGRFLLVSLEVPALKLGPTDDIKFKPFIPQGTFYCVIILFYCTYIIYGADVSIIYMFLFQPGTLIGLEY